MMMIMMCWNPSSDTCTTIHFYCSQFQEVNSSQLCAGSYPKLGERKPDNILPDVGRGIPKQ
jgi:hypothetical protein